MGSLALKGWGMNCSRPQSWEKEKEYEMRALTLANKPPRVLDNCPHHHGFLAPDAEV